MNPFCLIENEAQLLEIYNRAVADLASGRTQNTFASPDISGGDHVWSHLSPTQRILYAWRQLNKLDPVTYPWSKLERARRTQFEVYQGEPHAD